MGRERAETRGVLGVTPDWERCPMCIIISGNELCKIRRVNIASDYRKYGWDSHG